ncbi:hypothetical protein BJX70DRAFT_397641 [Aspergillus crustosus]
MRFGDALERVDIPVLLVSGWHDVFAPQTMEQYTRLSERNAYVGLLMGPWSHIQVGLDSKVHGQSFNRLEEHLLKRTQGTKTIYTNVVTAIWWSLCSPDDKPLPDEEPSTFNFDPKQPTPTFGGNLLLGGGSAGDTALATRSDVLTFTTEALEEDLEITEKVALHSSHSSGSLNVGLFVRLSEVDARGQSHGITETSNKRLDSDRECGPPLYLSDCHTDS